MPARKPIVLLPLVALALPLAAAPSQERPAADAAVPRIEFEKYTLPNGLDVILHVDRRLPVVHVNQWYHVGSKDERVGRSGFAHLFEHMMFQGSKNASSEYFEYVEEAGANLFEGGVNGTTSHDRTNYFATVPSGNLETILWLEADRLATLPEALTQEKLDNQRDVVKNERRQGLENVPYGRAYTLMFENLFPYRHPYANDVIGSHEDLSAATLDDVRDFFRTYYAPNNLSLVIAGDFEPAQAKRLVEKYFGSIPPGPPLAKPDRVPAALDGERVIEVRDQVPQERSYLAWHSPAYFAAGDAELDLAATILADGLSSRLDKALIYDRQLASDISAFQYSQELAGAFFVEATARPGTSLEALEAAITAEIARLARDGPTAQELARAQAKWETGFVTNLERIGGFGGKSDRLNMYNTYFGDPDRFDEDIARYRRATTASVRDAAARWLDTRNRVLVRFRPSTAERPTIAELDRSARPPLGSDRDFRAPEVHSSTLPNGLDVLVVNRSELPKVSATLLTRAGAVNDPAGREGLAWLTARMMRRGAGQRSALAIEEALGDLGTSLSASAGRETASLSTEVLTRHLDAALGLMATVAREPTFPAEELDREKKLLLDQLSQDAQNPNALASRIAPALVFGREHPYGRFTRGEPASVEAVTRDDLARLHRAHWRPGSATLVLVGDITPERARELAQRHFGAWSGGAGAVAEIPAAAPMTTEAVYVVDRPGAAQTLIAQVLPATARRTPDYHALVLADAVWGGGFGTRLNLNLREDKGWSYGVFSNPQLHTRGGAWIAMGGVQADKTKESIAEFVNELQGVAGARPISAEELAKAKANRVRGYAQGFESVSQVSNQVETLWVHDLPFTELQREAGALNAVTLEAARAAARRYAVPGQARLLLIGDRTVIENAVRELKLGPIVLLDATGRPARTTPVP